MKTEKEVAGCGCYIYLGRRATATVSMSKKIVKLQAKQTISLKQSDYGLGKS